MTRRITSTTSPTRLQDHSSSSTRLESAWSGVASPVGRYGVEVNAVRRVALRAKAASCRAVTSAPVRVTSISSARLEPRRRPPGEGGRQAAEGTGSVRPRSRQPTPTTNPPAWRGYRRSPPGETTGRTKARSAPVAPAAAFGPITPAKRIKERNGNRHERRGRGRRRGRRADDDERGPGEGQPEMRDGFVPAGASEL